MTFGWTTIRKNVVRYYEVSLIRRFSHVTIRSNDFRQFFFGKTTIRHNCITAKRRFDEVTFRENYVALREFNSSCVKLSKRDFDFYCQLLQKIIIVNSKFRNGSTNILCSVLNSRLLKTTILKFSFMFIEFRYKLSIHV